MKNNTIGFGTFGSDHCTAAEIAAAVEGALHCGYRFFDCASVYGNEAEIGAVFEKALNEDSVKREELFITSKVWNDMQGKGDILLSCAKTLHDLRLDYIDCFFVHWPFPNYHAPHAAGDSRNPDSKPWSATHFMQVWRQMERLQTMGLAKTIGMSNMTVKKLKEVLPECTIKPAFIEMELHPAFQQPELFDYCIKQGIQVIGYCPMGSPNRPERDKTPGDVIDTQMPEVQAIAQAHNIHPSMVCLKWAVQHGHIPIPFSLSPVHYQANLECVSTDPLTDAEMAMLAKADKNCRLVKGQVFLWPGAKDWRNLWD